MKTQYNQTFMANSGVNNTNRRLQRKRQSQGCIRYSKSFYYNPTTTLLLFIIFTSYNSDLNSATAESNSSPSNSPIPSIPRSTNTRSILPNDDDIYTHKQRPTETSFSTTNNQSSSKTSQQASKTPLPPWNKSPNIDTHGFLTELYSRIPGEWELESHIGGRHQYIDREEPVIIRQVPGDGNCLFHSITVSMAAIINGTHVDMSTYGDIKECSDTVKVRYIHRNGIVEEKRQMRSGSEAAGFYDEEHYKYDFIENEYDDSCYDMDNEDEEYEGYRYGDADEDEEEEEELSNSSSEYDFSTYGSRITAQKSKQSKPREPPSQPYVHDIRHLHHHSKLLRHQAVDMLSSNPRKLLFLQGNEYLRARDLVNAAAAQYDITGKEYCELMRKDSYWGGGPEIVALCNLLKRPIHVYELASCSPSGASNANGKDEYGITMTGERDGHEDNNFITAVPSPQPTSQHTQQFYLRRMACFGSPKFDRKEPLHILSADSRFPDLTPGKQLASGNHFLALFPREYMNAVYEAEKRRMKKLRKRRSRRHSKRKGSGFRGGAASRSHSMSSRPKNHYESSESTEEDFPEYAEDNGSERTQTSSVKKRMSWKKDKLCRGYQSLMRHALHFWTQIICKK